MSVIRINKKVKLYSKIFVFGALVLLFNNCGQGFKSLQLQTSASLNISPTPNPTNSPIATSPGPTATTSVSPSPSATLAPSSSPSPSISPTPSPQISPTPIISPTQTPQVSPSPNPSVTPTPFASPTTSGLEFLGTDIAGGNGSGTTPNSYFAFKNVHTDCLPIYPATIIWQAKPLQKMGYYTTFFWANDGSFLWNSGSPNTFWGAHPYPHVGINLNAHNWEIATDFGGDITQTLAGQPKLVVKGSWYTQGFRAWQDTNGQKVHRYYTELPSLATNNVIEARVSANFANVNPPSPALVFGGAPWGAGFGNDETYRGFVRGIQVYNAVLTENEMLQEATSPLSTAAGRNSIWYFKQNPTVDDLVSDVVSAGAGACAGKKRNPVWRVDNVDINLQNPTERSKLKVR